MNNYYLTDDQFIAEWNQLGSPQKFSEKHGMSVRSVYNRRRVLETKLKIELPTFSDARCNTLTKLQQTPGHARRGIEMEKGRIIVFSDAHFWPDEVSTSYKALLLMIKEFKPKVIVANGDMFDGSQASRHARIGWEKTPTVKEELQACQEMMAGIEAVSNGAQLIWTLGNHDARFETFLSAQRRFRQYCLLIACPRH